MVRPINGLIASILHYFMLLSGLEYGLNKRGWAHLGQCNRHFKVVVIGTTSIGTFER